MNKILLFIIACSLCSFDAVAQATVTWDGDVSTDWNEPLNWDTDAVPTASEIAVFSSNLTVTGTAPVAPVGLRLSSGAQVVFDLDLSIGDGVTAGNTVDLQSGSRLVLEDGRTFTILTESNSNGFQIGGSGNTTVNIKGTAVMRITGARHGINIGNSDADFIQRGTTTITNAAGNGIRLAAGSFTNLGSISINTTGSNAIDNSGMFTNGQSSTTSITIDGATNNGIKNKAGATFINQDEITINNTGGAMNDGVCTEGAWANEANGSIVVNLPEDDGIEVLEGSFANDGSINVTLKDGGTSGFSGVVIGTTSTVATMTNTCANSITVDGGTGASRNIVVETMGELTNTGMITLTNGDDGARLFVRGTFVNDLKGTLDLTDGRVNVNAGNLTNNGLILSTRGGTGIFSTGTVTNNAFFKYDGSNSFANNSSGTLTDNGLSLNRFNDRVIDITPIGGNTVDIAEVSYVWTYSGADIGTSDASGLLTVNCNAIDNDTINIRPEGLDFGSTPIRLRSVCFLPLPIELTSIEAVTMAKSIMVKWTTASEEANDFMAVERSVDGNNFAEIGRVDGAGFSQLTQDYELEDQAPVVGTNYYRLRQVDYDGSVTYSEVVAADFAGNLAGGERPLKVYPTVVGEGQPLLVDRRAATGTQASIFRVVDGNGRILNTVSIAPGVITELSVSNLHPGLYYLLSEEEGAISSVRFVVN